jgi:hypothetical protein
MSAVSVGAAGAAGTFDHVCDGTADEVQILAALADCITGDTVELSAGTFEIDTATKGVPLGVSLIGTLADGMPATILHRATTTYPRAYQVGFVQETRR